MRQVVRRLQTAPLKPKGGIPTLSNLAAAPPVFLGRQPSPRGRQVLPRGIAQTAPGHTPHPGGAAAEDRRDAVWGLRPLRAASDPSPSGPPAGRRAGGRSGLAFLQGLPGGAADIPIAWGGRAHAYGHSPRTTAGPD